MARIGIAIGQVVFDPRFPRDPRFAALDSLHAPEIDPAISRVELRASMIWRARILERSTYVRRRSHKSLFVHYLSRSDSS